MTPETRCLAVTGGLGFLGSAFIRAAVGAGVGKIVNLDMRTYAADERRLAGLPHRGRIVGVEVDVADRVAVQEVFERHRPDAVAHFAAESHVTRSEVDGDRFWRTNLEGTRSVLAAACRTGVERFLHVSTDEVYGPIEHGAFKERDKHRAGAAATSPYARSKAAADDLAEDAMSELPVMIVRPTNAFGPWQYPEKALPRWITRGLRGLPLLVWGDGRYVRQWLFSHDLAAGALTVLTAGEPGEVYNLGACHDPEITNLDVARWIAARLDLPPGRVRLTAYDRPAHDRRYAVDSTKARALGWRPGDVFEQLNLTLRWYRDNFWWWGRHVDQAEAIYSDDAHTISAAGQAVKVS